MQTTLILVNLPINLYHNQTGKFVPNLVKSGLKLLVFLSALDSSDYKLKNTHDLNALITFTTPKIPRAVNIKLSLFALNKIKTKEFQLLSTAFRHPSAGRRSPEPGPELRRSTRRRRRL